MSKPNYTNYYKNHSAYQNSEKLSEQALEIRIRSLRANFQKIIAPLDRGIRILEIGCGQGSFTEYLRREGFMNYTGFDFDSDVIQSNQNIFPEYHFSDDDVLVFLEKNPNSFDFVFMSHVYEHLTIEDGNDMAEKIHKSLKKNGVWINIMPNAASLFSATFGRYADLTHRVLYSSGSMNQQLLSVGFTQENITHHNTTFPYKIFEYYQKIVRFCANILLRSLGYMSDTVATFEIITIAKK